MSQLQGRTSHNNALGPTPQTNNLLRISSQTPSLGTNVELEQYSAKERKAALSRLHETGFTWVRQRFDWGQIEPQQGTFRWAQSDEVIRDITARNLVPVVVLDGSPRWARAERDSENPLAPPENAAHFAHFAQAFARRYRESVRIYQLWDEPNIAPHWGNRLIAPVEYARLLTAAGTAIRSVDAAAVIVVAALAPTEDRGHTAIDERFFLQRLYAAQRLFPSNSAAPNSRLFDVVAIQPFGFGHAPYNQRQHSTHLNFQRAAHIRNVMVAAGDTTTPIWAVRYGWSRQTNTTWQSVSPQQQRAFAVEALDIAQQRWPWLTAMGWAIDQPATEVGAPQWGFATDDSLQQAFQKWAAGQSSRSSRATSSAKIEQRSIDRAGSKLSLLVIVLLIAWRGWSAANLLPWTRWQSHYRKLPAWSRFGLWLLLLYLYNAAVWPPLVFLCLTAGTLFSIAQPLHALYLAAILLPFHYQHKELLLVDWRLTLPPAYAMLVCLLPALAQRMGAKNIHRCQLNRWDWCALAWLGLNLLSARHVWHWPGYYTGLMEFALAPLLFYAAVRFLVRTSAEVRQLLWALAAGGVLAALVGLLCWIGGGGTSADGLLRLVGPHFSPNHTALYLLRTLFVCGGLWAFSAFHYDGLFFANLQSKHLTMRVPSRARIAALQVVASTICIVVVFVALILTASRGALALGIPAGGMALWWYWFSSRQVSRSAGLHRARLLGVNATKFAMIAAIVLVGVLLIRGSFSLWKTPLWERLSNSGTVQRRVAIWRDTIDLWCDFRLVGVGPGGFFWRYPAYILDQPLLDPNLRHPHNVWLEYLASWGILGVVWLVGVCLLYAHSLGCWFRAEQTRNSWLYMGITAGLVAAIAHGQVDTFGLLPDLAAWNWVGLGLWSGRAAIEEQHSKLSSTFLRSVGPTFADSR